MNYQTIKNEPMWKHTTFQVGGKGAYVLCNSTKELMNVINCTKKLTKNNKNIKKNNFKIIGNGSNLLILNKLKNIIFIKLGKNFSKIKIIKNNKNYVYLEVGASVNLFALNKYLINNKFSGLEFSYGIPASVGGAVVNNAGAFGGEICKNIYKIKILENNKIFWMNKFEYSYRKTEFQNNNKIILSVIFKLKKVKTNIVEKRCNYYLEKRIKTQPYNKKTAGSVFKRQNEIIPAKLIDNLGLKGVKIGCASVSTKHAGFIVNNGGKSGKDILRLIEKIEKLIFVSYGVKLEREIEVIGE